MVDPVVLHSNNVLREQMRDVPVPQIQEQIVEQVSQRMLVSFSGDLCENAACIERACVDMLFLSCLSPLCFTIPL